MFSLKNKVAIVTGASRGIGKSIAQKMSEAGAHLVCVSRTNDDLEKISNELNNAGYSASPYPCDVSILNDFKKLVDDTASEFGKIDILVNNAGITHLKAPLEEISENEFDRVIAVNTKSVYLTAKHVVPLMKQAKKGSILNVA